jgi:hypothetical protein
LELLDPGFICQPSLRPGPTAQRLHSARCTEGAIRGDYSHAVSSPAVPQTGLAVPNRKPYSLPDLSLEVIVADVVLSEDDRLAKGDVVRRRKRQVPEPTSLECFLIGVHGSAKLRVNHVHRRVT